jgi:hypothetical protein
MRLLRALALTLSFAGPLAGCPDGTGEDTEAAKAAVEKAWAEANPAGRTGVELRGRTVWLEAPFFEKSCLEKNDLAFNDDARNRPPGSPARISATYEAQRFLLASTPEGFCVYLGDDPAMTVNEVSWAGDAYKVTGTVTMGKATKWFECLDTPLKTPTWMVKIAEDGTSTIDGDVSLHQGGCPNPLPEGEERGPGKTAPTEGHKAPSKADVKKLATKLDDALFEGDLRAVRDLTACYNLEDKAPYFQNCSAGEFVSLGHAFHGEQRAQDGVPWTELAIRDLDDIRRIVPDGKMKGMYHATMIHKRTKRERSFAVQWVDGSWKMVGVIGRKAEALTSVRYIYDLHKRDKRDIFLRRMDGEVIDEAGDPPFEDEQDE